MRPEYNFLNSVKNFYAERGNIPLEPDEIPHEVAGFMLEKGYSPAKAWRVYLRMSQKDAAKKLGISQAALSQIENNENNQRATLEKIAVAYGIHVEQLEV